MAIATGFHHHHLPLPLSRTPRRATLFLDSPAAAGRARATATPPPRVAAAARKRDDDGDGAITDGPEPRRKSSPLLDLAPLLSAAAAAAAAGPRAALAASGGSMGGSSDDSSSSFSSSSCDSSSSSDDSWWSSSPSVSEEGKKEATHESVGTAPVELSPAAKRRQDMIFWGGVALASAAGAALVKAALQYAPPRTTVVKLQAALRGVAAAKSFQKDLNDIAEKVEASNQRWYKFILTETIRSLRRHKDSCISSSLSDYWKEHFNKISIEERSKFDAETFSNLDGIKRKRSYSKKTDGSRNEYIVLTILIAAEGELKFPGVIRSSADLEAVVGKLNSVPAGEIRGIHVLWTPQQENDVLSEEELKEDYPYLKPFA
ncbi:unnamed protein product [Urochloa decumbens]|uniref:Uncharacterized protein n=1 Tax=Urochloa decumbens TaxID=240449 RepID=A0ABC9BPH4_9POAL